MVGRGDILRQSVSQALIETTQEKQNPNLKVESVPEGVNIWRFSAKVSKVDRELFLAVGSDISMS